MSARLLTRDFLFASCAMLTHALGFHLFLHLPGFFKARGSDETAIGTLFSAGAVAAILARPSVGRWMDRHGRRPPLIVASLVSTGAASLYLLVDHLGLLAYVARIAQGVGAATMFSALFAYASDIVPAERRIEGIGLFGAAGMLPVALGGVIGDAILALGSYRHVFGAAVVCNAIAIGLVLPLREHHRAEGNKPARSIVRAALEPTLLPLWVGGLVFAIALTSLFSFLKTFVMTTELGSVGAFFSAYAAAAIALRVFFGRLPERVGPKRVLAPSYASAMIGMLLLAVADDAATLLVAGVACGIGHGFVFPILMGMVVERCRPEERGAALAMFTALFDLGILVGGPTLGMLIEGVGYRAMFVVCAIVLLAGGITLFGWDRVIERRSKPHPEML